MTDRNEVTAKLSKFIKIMIRFVETSCMFEASTMASVLKKSLNHYQCKMVITTESFFCAILSGLKHEVYEYVSPRSITNAKSHAHIIKLE